MNFTMWKARFEKFMNEAKRYGDVSDEVKLTSIREFEKIADYVVDRLDGDLKFSITINERKEGDPVNLITIKARTLKGLPSVFYTTFD